MNIWLGRLFFLLILSLGFMLPSIRFSGMSLQTTEIVFVAAAFVLGAAALFRRVAVFWDRSYLFFATFVITMAISAVFSEDLRASGVKLLGICYLVGLALMTIYTVSHERIFLNVVYTWISASTIVSVIGVITVLMFYVDRGSPWNELFLHHYGSLPAGNYPRIQSTFLYPAMLCNYLTVGNLLSFGAWRDGLIRGTVAGVVFVIHLIAAVFTFTPGLGGLLLAVGSASGWYLIKKGARVSGGSVLAFGIAAAVVFTAVATVSIWPIGTSPYTFEVLGYRLDPTQRLLAWQDAYRSFSDHPLIGKGIGTDAVRVIFQTPSGQMQILTDAHNSWLSVAAQAGLVGLLALIALCVHLARRGREKVSSVQDLRWIYRCSLIAFVSCFIVQGLVGSFEDARHLWVLMGILIAGNRIRNVEISD